MILTTSDLELLVGRKQPTNLFEGLRRYDEIAGRSTSGFDRYLHLGETMTIRRDHPHRFGLELPEHTIEDRSTFFRAHCERRVRDQLLQIARSNAPTFVESDG